MLSDVFNDGDKSEKYSDNKECDDAKNDGREYDITQDSDDEQDGENTLFAAVERELEGVGAADLDIPLTRSKESEELSHAYDYLFEDELENLLSGKVRSAFIVTPVLRPDMLAMFCANIPIQADCIKSDLATIVILPNDMQETPEEIAQKFDFEVLLVVNRANRIEAHEYCNGVEGESYTPSIFFANYPAYLEDLAIGIENATTLESMGIDVFHVSNFDPNKTAEFSQKMASLRKLGKLDDEHTFIHSTNEL